MEDPTPTDATVHLVCLRCDREFLLPLDDIQELICCLFCGAPELTLLTSAASDRSTGSPAATAGGPSTIEQDVALLDGLIGRFLAGLAE